MDEIDLFGTLRPRSADDLTSHRERARVRLEAAMAGPGARARTRRFEGLPLPGRKVVAVSGAALAMGGAVVLPTVLSLGQGGGALVTSAWAVQPRKDGTVKVTIKDASDPAGLQRALRTAGVRAVVVSPREFTVAGPGSRWAMYPVCTYRSTGPWFAPAAVQRAVVTRPSPAQGQASSPRVIAYIHPAAMPPGSVLFIVDTYRALRNGIHVLSITEPAVLKSSTLPRCVAHPMPVPAVTPFPTPSSPTPFPSATGSPTPVPTQTSSPFPSASPTPTQSASPSPRPTRTTSPTPRPTPTSPTPVPTQSASPSPRPTRSASPEPTPS